MKTTGYALRDAIKQHELNRDTAAGTFNDSLKSFPGEAKPYPEDVVETYEKAEAAITRLQVAQLQYNLAVVVEVSGEKMTLAEAIKRLGYVGRIEKMWKGAINEAKNPYESNYRDPTQVHAVRMITAERALVLSKAYGRQANSLRAAIALANGQEVEVSDLDASLFE